MCSPISSVKIRLKSLHHYRRFALTAAVAQLGPQGDLYCLALIPLVNSIRGFVASLLMGRGLSLRALRGHSFKNQWQIGNASKKCY
jgi:hypothetical protein